ncbi:MAG: DciA family protein [candidate division WWE3 bacterium]|nr:DciA family protein [candidate division WWE3 bacterium]
MAFEKIGQSFEHSFRRGPIRSAVLALRVEKEAQKHLPDWARMISFREGRLLLATPSPAHSQELYLQSLQLRQKINASLQGKAVEEIRFRTTESKI